MAENLKPVEKLKKRLEILKCPFVNDVDNDWILEHLTKPCLQRIQILQWLFSKIDSKMAELINNNKFADERKQIKDLLTMASDLGFCSPEQIDFIKGTATPKDQIRFLSLIIDTVEICLEQPMESLPEQIPNPDLMTQIPGLETEYERQCQLICDITRQPSLVDNLFSCKIELLPADIKRQVDLNISESTEHPKFRVSSSVIQYRKKVDQLHQELESYGARLDALKQEFGFYGFNKDQLNEHCQQLSQSVMDLRKQIENFNLCYEKEMRIWCNRQPVVAPTKLGPVFNHAYNLLNNFELMLSSFEDVHVSCDRIETLKTSEPEKQPLKNSADEILLDIQELLKTLENSVSNCRQDSLEVISTK